MDFTPIFYLLQIGSPWAAAAVVAVTWLSHEKKRELVENLLSRVTVDRAEIDFELKYLPGDGKKQPHSHLFNYAKDHDTAWTDPNEALMPP